MNTLCLHHNDADGRASGAIVRRALGKDITLYEMDYGESLPLDLVVVADHIVIVDFSLPKAEMEQLANYHQFTWIDHHKSAIDEMDGTGENWAGVRDTSEAACVLTWRYFFPDQPVPKAVKLIGDRDIWRWAEPDTGAFNEGLHQSYTRPDHDDLWKPLLDDRPEILARIIELGGTLRDARLRDIRRATARYSFSATFEGYRTLVINLRGSGDLGAQIRTLGYQMGYCYVDKVSEGQLMTFVSLYSDEVDVSRIAQKFGGGGHAGAAGFHFPRGASPFPPGAKVRLDLHTTDDDGF
jgi:oligoribonuclease NrnB/cAMP/cGMP phosphodiesterase (DHH superfamily)